MEELLAALIGLLLGHWLGLQRARQGFVFERKVEYVSEFLDHAYTCLGDLALGKPPEGAGERKRQLTLWGHRAAFLVKDETAAAVDAFTSTFARGLSDLSGPEHAGRDVFKEVKWELDDLKATLRDEVKIEGRFWRRGSRLASATSVTRQKSS